MHLVLKLWGGVDIYYYVPYLYPLYLFGPYPDGWPQSVNLTCDHHVAGGYAKDISLHEVLGSQYVSPARYLAESIFHSAARTIREPTDRSILPDDCPG